ncbi:YceI family protein [Ichthyobacterium seriolicida]|uniref:Uncharacterized protein n=1 Tax=Ichthyobacterium seriolicida TaxID=242600 RepID=A0A1J1E6G0_9FLAO|nr:YceI family protein [Ichthyobacterium seriolicida]BAV94910.1 hypothetical protein JBKA6_0897 [Ichthyobacterium seriolicida]
MKKLSLKIIQIFIISLLVSCFSDKDEYFFSSKNIKLKWTAYKTTDKVPVSGLFEEVYISGAEKSHDLGQSIKNMTFRIPISSINTHDKGRDLKIMKHFFSSMVGTSNIQGYVKEIAENNIVFSITLNDTEKDISASYTKREDGVLVISAKMDLLKWNASSSIKSLNAECVDLHKGTDGISKLWNEVDIEIEVDLKII